MALGASNLTRGFATVVHAAREAWGEPLEVFGALGHGRSYGAWSRIPFRELPGILESELWADLAARPDRPTRALITDVGNDVLYGAPVPTILEWVEETIDRLTRFTSDIVITDLPLHRGRHLRRWEFEVFRSVLVPSCTLCLEEALERAGQANEGVVALATRRGLPLVRMRPEWYGADPIHIRPSCWAAAWREILFCQGTTPAEVQEPGAPSHAAVRRLNALRLYLAAPRRRRLFGVMQERQQPAIRLATGTEVWVY